MWFNFSKQHNNSECAQNHKNTGKITQIWALYGQFYTNARMYEHACINTADLVTLDQFLQDRKNGSFVSLFKKKSLRVIKLEKIDFIFQ